MDPWISVVIGLGVAPGALWAAYLVAKDFEPEVGTSRSRLYGALFLLSLPALALVRWFDRRHGR